MDDLVDTKVYVKCGGEKTGERMDQVGALWKEIVGKYTHYKLWSTTQKTKNNQA